MYITYMYAYICVRFLLLAYYYLTYKSYVGPCLIMTSKYNSY